MKITSEQLDALKQAQEHKKADTTSPEAFQKMLAQEARRAEGAQSTSQAALRPPGGASELYATIQANQTGASDNHSEPTVMDKMDSVLNRWENYAQLIGSTPPDLRQGYQMLESISKDLGELEHTLPDSGQAAEQLRPILDELEILTMTERVKFNRGDYI